MRPIWLFAACLALGACATVNKTFDKPSRQVTVDVPYNGDIAPTTVVAWTSGSDSALGVGHLSNKDYAQALASFEAACAKDPNDADAHFGAGVAAEMMNNLPKAEEHYKKANLIKTTPAREAAVARILAKQGK